MSRQVIALSSLIQTGKGQSSTERAAAAPMPSDSGAGCSASGASSCGTGSATEAALPPEIQARIADHPCYSEKAHNYFARMHVAVAPACNIQCHYCNRKYDCANESRPGVVSERLTPEQAVAKVKAVAAEMPQLSVVGIAGPGDALANPARTFETFEAIAAELPDIRLCLSTNGLALPSHVDRIKALGVDHVTITLNTLDPAIGAQIYAWVVDDRGPRGKKRIRGTEGAALLLERQLAGLDALVAAGVLVKVNSVMIPGINDGHLPEVNQEMRRRGAFLHNIMPLIARPEHGTHFGLTGQPEPSATALQALQERCEDGTRLMRHCRQCRADAVGMLGEDRSAEFTADKLAERPAAEIDQDARAAYRRYVADDMQERAERKAELEGVIESTADAQAAPAPVLTVAATSVTGSRINDHFGRCKEFHIYRIGPAGMHYLGARRVDNYCQGGWGDQDRWPALLDALSDCQAVLVARIGDGPRQRLAEAGIEAVTDFRFDYVEEAVLGYYHSRLQATADSPATTSRVA